MIQRLIRVTSTTTFALCGSLIVVNSTQAQIIPDQTTNTKVINNCQADCELTGGIVARDNLFHSFQEFNIAPEARVYFQDPGVANIFSRVTGNNPSNIFGTLGVEGGNANLFLLNPNGILFGKGAALDLNGSFLATTADQIQFGDRSFVAIPDESENLALLTINPSVLLFDQMGKNSPIILESTNLATSEQQNLALLAQSNNNSPAIELKNSRIRVVEGNIGLGAVKNKAKITLTEDFLFEFPADTVLSNISIADSSKVDALNLDAAAKREIRIDSHNFEIAGNSRVFSAALGTNNGAEININARSAVNIIGIDAADFQEFIAEGIDPNGSAFLDNSLQANTFGAGNAGDIQIMTPKLLIDHGGGIVNVTNSQGKSGNINLKIADRVTLTGSGLLTGSSILSSGNVGEINLDTRELLIEQNGVISSSTLGEGNAGSLTITASEAIEIKDTLANAVIPTGIFTNTVINNGKGGNLNLKTPQLTLQNGGQLSASSGVITSLGIIDLGGQGGNITLEIDKALNIIGESADGKFISSILSDTRTLSPAGNVKIKAGDIYVDSLGLISTSSIGDGVGGNIEIDSDNSINVNGGGSENLQALIIDGLGGKLNPSSVRGGIAAYSIGNSKAGSITINTDSLQLDLGAVISTATYGHEDAGDLTINASEKINVVGSAIVSPTFGAGNGGNIKLKTNELNITQGGAIASASTNQGTAGDITISATESIAIFDIIPDLLFSGSISTGSYGGLGASGNLTLNTQRLTVKDGANIETNNVFFNFRNENLTPEIIRFAGADAKTIGKLTINATESIEISGYATEANILNSSPNSHIHSITNTASPASNVEINTGELILFDGGEISVSSFGNGAAGSLAIKANSVTLKDRANINGTTLSGRGSDINLQVQEILDLDHHSVINTNAKEAGSGGNIDIEADFVIARSSSEIAASALANGKGGNIQIVANDIFLTDNSSINADSELGIDGTVKLKTLLNTERNNLTRLPQIKIQSDNRIIESCNSNSDRQGIFSYTGRGGLPFNPLTDFQVDNLLIADLDILERIETKNQIKPEANSQLELLLPQAVEVDRWQINAQGKVELVAANHNLTALNFNSACPLARHSRLLKDKTGQKLPRQ